MTASSVTGTGHGSAEGPLANLSLDYIRKVFVLEDGVYVSCVDFVGDKYVLKVPEGGGGGNATSLINDDAPVIISGNPSVQCTEDGNTRGTKAWDFQCCRDLATQVASGDYSFIAGGCKNTADGDFSHAEGYQTTAIGADSHSEGHITIAQGTHSHAEGYESESYGASSHAEGISTTAGGEGSHSEGYNTHAGGYASHTEGSTTVAYGEASHAEGYYTIASQLSSHAEGSLTTASGAFAHAEGFFTIASEDSAHSEGNNTTASGAYSHSEGQGTQATGYASHAEGNITVAAGYSSHAEGRSTTANGAYSHAGGYLSDARIRGMFARSGGNFGGYTQAGEMQHTSTTVCAYTTDDSPTVMTIDRQTPGVGNVWTVPQGTSMTVTVTVIARQDNNGLEKATFIRYVGINNTTGVVALIGAVETIGTDKGSNGGAPPAGWGVTIVANDTDKTLDVVVTGATDNTIRWAAVIESIEVRDFNPSGGGA